MNVFTDMRMITCESEFTRETITHPTPLYRLRHSIADAFAPAGFNGAVGNSIKPSSTPSGGIAGFQAWRETFSGDKT